MTKYFFGKDLPMVKKHVSHLNRALAHRIQIWCPQGILFLYPNASLRPVCQRSSILLSPSAFPRSTSKFILTFPRSRVPVSRSFNSSCVPVFLIRQEPLEHKTRNARPPLLLSGNIPDTKGTIVLDIFVSGMPKHKYNFACVMLKLSARWTIKKNCVQFWWI